MVLAIDWGRKGFAQQLFEFTACLIRDIRITT